MTITYHKIQSVFKRDPDNNYRTFLYGEWADEVFGYLADNLWYATEKIDGTNCRIHVYEDDIYVGGRTEQAELHNDLFVHLEDVGIRALEQEGFDGLTLFGEGYGAGIQKGGAYRDDKGFILFDVMVTETGIFLHQEDVQDIADRISIPMVFPTWQGILTNAVHIFQDGDVIESFAREGQAEGWVLRPKVELCNRRGGRVITKLKVKDFPEREA